MKLMLMILSLLFSFSAFATCMSTCEETDAGLDPQYGSTVKQVTTCAPPGGPSNSTTEYFVEDCKKNMLKEYVCEGGSGAGHAVVVKIPCAICSKDRKGVCYEVGKGKAPQAAIKAR